MTRTETCAEGAAEVRPRLTPLASYQAFRSRFPWVSLSEPEWEDAARCLGEYRKKLDRCFECQRYIPTGDIGRCDACFRRRPPALALKVGRHRIEYPAHVVQAMPAALRKAFEASPTRIR